MRKTIIAFLVFLASVVAGTRTLAATPSIDYGKRVNLLMKEYSGHADFQLINLGRVGLALAKAAIRQQGDRDAQEILSLMRDIKHVSIASYEDCSDGVKKDFANRLSKVLSKEFLLIQAKDHDDKVEIYAFPSDDGKDISGLVINAPGSGAVICVRGLIRTNDVASFINSRSK